jgi:hypothetical protein
LKRIFSVILVFLLLCGCKSQTKITPLKTGITFSANATYYNETYECDCDIQKNGDMTVKFTYPAEIEGLKFVFTKNGISVNFKDIEYVSDNIVFENSVASLLHEVISKDNTEIYEYNDVFYFDGVNNDFEYRMEFGATGLPIKITTKPDVAKIEFRNVKII